MALIAVLLTNGYLMVRAERALRGPGANIAAGWKTLRLTSGVSMVLWFTIALAGIILVNM
jgi:hypothetical protein